MTPAAQDRLLDEALGSEWRAARLVSGQREVRCPLHDDHSPSLHVHEGSRTWICRAGCGGGGAWDLATRVFGEDRAREIVRDSDEDTTARNGFAESRRIDDRDSPRVETLGPVTDAQREALGLSRRVLDEKTYEAMRIDRVRVWGEDWIRIPALDGSKLWAVSDQGMARGEKGKLQRRNVGPVSLACSPALREAIEGDTPPRVERLYDVEGESDLLALCEAGAEFVLSTTGGASSLAGHERHADALLELDVAEVVVVRDRDDAGRGGAAKAAEWWRSRGVAVRVVELPDELGEAGDLRDYLNGKPKHGDLPATEPLGDLLSLEALADAAKRLEHEVAANVERAAGSRRTGPRARVATLADVQPERIEWLWFGRIPLAKVTVIDGDPGLGKSSMTLDLAARVSRGAPMPDDSPGGAGDVVLVSYEDGLADTIRPRLDAARADMLRVHSLCAIDDGEGIERAFSMPEDIPILEAEIRKRSARLVVIDPLMAALSAEVNSYRDQDVRRALHPLKEMAEATGAAVVVVRHLNKGSGAALYRGGGSIGISGAARSALLVAKDPDDEGKRVLAPVKANLAGLVESLSFELEDAGNGHPRIQWLGASTRSADDLVTAPSTSEERTERDEAKDFLRSILADGPVPQKDVMRAAKQEGIHEKTLRRAKRDLRIESTKRQFSGGWEWTLPEDGHEDAKAVTPLAMTTFGRSWPPSRGAPSPDDSEDWAPLGDPPGELDL